MQRALYRRRLLPACLSRIFSECMDGQKCGLPTEIHAFTEPMFRAMCTQLGTRQAMGTVKHPETDGQTERMNRVLEETLRHYVNDRMDNWDTLLPTAEFAVNNSYQQSIRTTPFYLNYGYHPNVPLDVGVSPEPQSSCLFTGQPDSTRCHRQILCICPTEVYGKQNCNPGARMQKPT